VVRYADSSALIKLVVAERESDALRAYLRGERPTSSVIAYAEVLRAARRRGAGAEDEARALLRALTLIAIDDAILETAATLEPAAIRTLDAIHLATALVVGDDLDAIVTYDGRMATAARTASLEVAAPE